MSENELGTVTVLEREVTFQIPNAVQTALLHRLGKVAETSGILMEKFNTPGKKSDQYLAAADSAMDSLGKILDIFGSLVAAPEDESWLVTQMLNGKLDDKILLDMLNQLVPVEEKEQLKPKTRARRG